MKKNLFQCGLTLVSVFCLSLSFLFSVSVSAADLKPFITIKAASPETLLSVAEKIAQLANTASEFNAAVEPFKELNGFNASGSLGFVLHSDGKEIQEPVLVLPVKDVNAIQIPGAEMLIANLKKTGDGQYLLNSPGGIFRIHQKKEYLFALTENSTLKIPDDPKAFFAGLDDYTLAFKIDFENTSLESIEAALAMPLMFLAMQGGQQGSQTVEMINESLPKIYEEISSLTIGITFEPKSADVTLTTITVPKKGSESEKQVAEYKNAKTAFGGFVGKNNAILSINDVETLSATDINVATETVEQLLNAALSYIEEQEETEETTEFAQSVINSLQKIITASLAKGKFDMAATFFANGALFAAITAGNTDEIEKLVTKIIDSTKKEAKKQFGDSDVDDFFKENLKKDFTTIEGFRVSGLKIPLEDVAGVQKIPAKLAKETVAILWGVKKDDSVAVAIGFDFDKTEKAFFEALNQTKTPAPIKQPVFFAALQPLGKLLKQYVDPNSEDEAERNIAALGDILNGAGSDAQITGSAEVVGNGAASKIFVSGKVITTLIKLAKFASGDLGGSPLDRSQIKSF